MFATESGPFLTAELGPGSTVEVEMKSELNVRPIHFQSALKLKEISVARVTQIDGPSVPKNGCRQ
jgi:hypothetical protein